MQKQKNIYYYLIFLLFFSPIAFTHAQSPDNQILTLKEYYAQIILYHPIVRQANLWNELARQEIRMSRGGFDPKISLDYDSKEFDKKNYYNLLDTKLKVPLWIGEFNASYQNNSGQYLNPENTTDERGLTAIGFTLPIGKGLMMNERRSILQQAKFFQNIAEAEKIKAINKVLWSAAKQYWEWYFNFQQYHFIEIGAQLAKDRFEAVKRRVVLGELAAIDSVQAKITLQERLVQLTQAKVDLTNSKIMLANYLWAENDTPVVLSENVSPESFTVKVINQAKLDEWQNFSKENHPEIRKLKGKLQQLEIEEKLQANNLLPNLNLKYNLLSNYQPNTATDGFRAQNNYKFGVQFDFPLFLRKERAKLQQVRIKQFQSNFELTQTIRDIQNEIQTAYNELLNLSEQIQLQQEMVNNYVLLRDGELRRFANGESSLFLINTQETKLIEAQIKLESQKSKYEKARATLIWAAGGQVWE